MQCVATRRPIYYLCRGSKGLRCCCSVLQCVAVCCNVLQCVAAHCGALQCVAVCCGALQCVAVRCSALQCVAVRCSALQCVGSVLQLQHADQPIACVIAARARGAAGCLITVAVLLVASVAVLVAAVAAHVPDVGSSSSESRICSMLKCRDCITHCKV